MCGVYTLHSTLFPQNRRTLKRKKRNVKKKRLKKDKKHNTQKKKIKYTYWLSNDLNAISTLPSINMRPSVTCHSLIKDCSPYYFTISSHFNFNFSADFSFNILWSMSWLKPFLYYWLLWLHPNILQSQERILYSYNIVSVFALRKSHKIIPIIADVDTISSLVINYCS